MSECTDYMWCFENPQDAAEEIDRLTMENARLREALEFYAEETNYTRFTSSLAFTTTKSPPVESDMGKIAREALKKEEVC